MQKSIIVGLGLALLLAGCQSTPNTTGARTSYESCTESPSRLAMTNYYGTKCTSQYTKKIGLDAITYRMTIRGDYHSDSNTYANSNYFYGLFYHGKAGNNTIYNFSSAEAETRRYSVYKRAGGYIEKLPKYQGKNLKFEVTAWRSSNKLRCRTYYAGKGLTDFNEGLENVFALHLCTAKRRPSAWYESFADAMHADHMFNGLPLKTTGLTPRTNKGNFKILGISQKDRIAFDLNWSEYATPLKGYMSPIGPRKRGRTYLVDKAKDLECEGQWGHHGPANKPPKGGFWSMKCTNGKALNGSFRNDGNNSGIASGRDTDGQNFKVSYKPE